MDADTLRQKRDEIETHFLNQYTAAITAPSFLGDQPKHERQRNMIRRAPGRNLLFLPSEPLDFGDAPGIAELSKRHARALVGLAEAALESGAGSVAFELLNEAACYDPRHPTVEAVLGTGSLRKLPTVRPGTTRHSRLRWREGKYWWVLSEQFRIATQDREAGIAMAQRLEHLHAVWHQLFFDYWSSADELRDAWRRRKRLLRPGRSRHRITLFADRQEYVAYLRSKQARIGITLGFYDLAARSCFFFAGPGSSAATQYHEATHQLFQECGPKKRGTATGKDFWIVEGIALYMESLRIDGPTVRVGGWDASRLQFATVSSAARR